MQPNIKDLQDAPADHLDPANIFDSDVSIEGPEETEVGDEAPRVNLETDLDIGQKAEEPEDVVVEEDAEDEGTVELETPTEPKNEEPSIVPEKKSGPTPEEMAEAKAEAERKSRASERIRELANRTKAAEEEAEAARKAAFEAQKKVAETMRLHIEQRIAQAEKDLQAALDVGDAAATTKHLKDLQGFSADYSKLNEFLETNKEYVPPKKTASTTVEEVDGDEALTPAYKDWASKHKSWVDTASYGKLPVEARKQVLPIRNWAREVGNRLVEEGFTPDSPLFFEELDLRMEDKFGEQYKILAEKGVDMLVLHNSNKTPSSGETLNTPNKAKSTKTPQQKASSIPVAAASSNAATTNGNPSSAKRTMKYEDLPYEAKKTYDHYMSSYMTKTEFVKQWMTDNTNL